MLRDAGTPHRTSPGTAAAFGCKCQYKGYLLLLQVTAAHTGVGKGHLKLDLNLTSQGLAEITPGAQQLTGMCCASSQTLPKPQTLALQLLHHLYSQRSRIQRAEPGKQSPHAHQAVPAFNETENLGGECFEVQIAAKGLGEVLLANTIRVGSSSLRGGYHAGIEQLELLKHKALVYQVNKPGR